MPGTVEPTYATQRTPSRYSDGPAVGEALARHLGRRPTPSQQRELDVALERVDGPGSPFVYDDVTIVKGRRCGKTVTGFGVPLVRALAGPISLPNGRRLPFRAVHVAQDLTNARTRFDEDLVIPYRQPFTEEQWDRAVDYKRAAGDTHLTIDPRTVKDIAQAKLRSEASDIRILAPTANAARGAGVFHRTYDEELTYKLERGQELAAAGRPTMSELLGHGQTWHLSNVTSTTDARMFLWHQRQKGREAVAADRRDGICYIEYSMPPGVDPEDETQWPRYHPGLAEGIVGLAQLRRDREEFEALNHDNGATFYAEYFCRWPDENPQGLAQWKTLDRSKFYDAGTSDEQPAEAAAALGVEIDLYDRSASIFTVVDGNLAELIERRPGSSDWVRGRVLELEPRVEAIGIDTHISGNANLAESLKGTPAEKKLVILDFNDITAACFTLDSELGQGVLTWRHNEFDPYLLEAAAAAERTAARAWVWERRVTTPQDPIFAWTVALWALRHRPQTPAPQIW